MIKNHSKMMSAIYDVTEKQHKWHKVLELICQETGATKAILSLRDQSTARLVIPTSVKEEHRSPMLYNFDKVTVDSFLSTYSQHDPWTEIEKLHPSPRPFALSNFLDHEDLVNSQFWKWLEPQGISDCIVLNIGQLPKQWIALNIYFSHNDAAIRDGTLALTSELLPHLRQAWKLGETIRENFLSQDRTLFFLEKHNNPAILLKHDRTVIAANKKIKKLQDKDVFISNNKISFKSPQNRDKFDQNILQLDKQPDHHKSIEFILSGYAFTLSLIGEIEDHLGADKATRLLVFRKCGDLSTILDKPIWEEPILTARESELVKHLAKGGRVNTFEGKDSDGRWRKIKEKFEMEHPREVFRTHLIYKAYQNNG